jgi:catechol-2,3-dioxygenase
MTEDAGISLEIRQVRVSRPTNQLDKLEQFYCDGLGLTKILSFPEDAAGYLGVILGLPGHPYYLEFCTHRLEFESCRPPTQDNLLVFYLETSEDLQRVKQHMSQLGYPAVPSTNPHWDLNGITFEDPDGWRVVLMVRSNV